MLYLLPLSRERERERERERGSCKGETFGTASEWGSNTCTLHTASETGVHFDITCILIIPRT